MLIEIYSYFYFKNSHKNSGQEYRNFHIVHLTLRYGPLYIFQVQVILINVWFYQVSM